MQIGVIGLGRMGGNISRRLMKAGHKCVVFDANVKTREALAKDTPPIGAVRRAPLPAREAKPLSPYAWWERSEGREAHRLSGGRQSGREAP